MGSCFSTEQFQFQFKGTVSPDTEFIQKGASAITKEVPKADTYYIQYWVSEGH